ncbi:hypothetical protein Q7O_000336 [Pectobacterium carotovorum subsp. carotovorum PCCS1]|nr:hypothetical protein [Pectobacterium carotovorum subsp. carotovorum PCCS1]
MHCLASLSEKNKNQARFLKQESFLVKAPGETDDVAWQ